MMLSIQQQFIYSLLCDYHCLRRNQLLTILQRSYAETKIQIDRHRMDVMLAQLCHCSTRVRTEGELVMLDGVKPNYLLLEAIDVMLELSEKMPLHVSSTPQKPYVLRFTGADAGLSLYSVLRLDTTIPELRRASGERVIWLCTPSQVLENIRLPPKHYLAVRQSDGTHRYFGSEEPQNKN